MITDAILAIFVLTFVGMAIGRIPGLRTDRAGLALVAAVLMVVVTGADLKRTAEWVDLSTLALLFGLMVLSAQFGICGFYDYCADRITRAPGSPQRLLAITIVVAALLSAVLTNDIITVPSDILLLQVWDHPPQEALYALALLSTFAGNLLLAGSLANLIVAEREAAVGASLPFLAHARAGVPITILTSAVAALWLWLAGVVPL